MEPQPFQYIVLPSSMLIHKKIYIVPLILMKTKHRVIHKARCFVIFTESFSNTFHIKYKYISIICKVENILTLYTIIVLKRYRALDTLFYLLKIKLWKPLIFFIKSKTPNIWFGVLSFVMCFFFSHKIHL